MRSTRGETLEQVRGAPIYLLAIARTLFWEQRFGSRPGGIVDAENIPVAAINAHFRLMQLNFQSWKPDVEKWLHSDEAEASLQELLMNVPCSPTLH